MSGPERNGIVVQKYEQEICDTIDGNRKNHGLNDVAQACGRSMF